jgi:SWI/SNF-related matrix-associated actin-dependent regulator 1 of chromatin subfamily A
VIRDLPPIKHWFRAINPVEFDFTQLSSFAHFTWPIDRMKEFREEIEKQTAITELILKNTPESLHTKLLAGCFKQTALLRRYHGMLKVGETVEMVENGFKHAFYSKVVIIAQHADVIEEFRIRLSEYRPVTLYGGTDDDKRSKHQFKFRMNPKCRVAICNPFALRAPMDLTPANRIFIVEPSPNPDDNAQAILRVHSKGQRDPVRVFWVGLYKSLDMRSMYQVKLETQKLTAQFVDPRPIEDDPDLREAVDLISVQNQLNQGQRLQE